MPLLVPEPGIRSGERLRDGFSTLISITGVETMDFWETEVTPPGVDGGDAVDTSTMHNTRFRTKKSRDLIEMTDMESTVAYDPTILNAIIDATTGVQKEAIIAVHHSDGSNWTFWGYLKSFVPGASTEGDMPTGTITIVVTNTDPATGAEIPPEYNAT